MYEIGMALKNIKKNFFLYILLTLEITIATAFIISSINAEKSATGRKIILNEQFGKNSIVVRHYSLSEKTLSQFPFYLKDLNFIRKKISNKVSMNFIYNTSIFNKDDIIDFPIVYTSNLELKKGKAVVGKGIIGKLDLEGGVFDDDILKIKDNKLYYNKYSFDIVENDDAINQKYLTMDLGIEDIDLEKSVILPLELLDVTKSNLGNIVIDSPTAKDIKDILQYLQKNHSGQFTYKYYNLVNSFEKTVKDFNTELYFLKQVAYIMILQLIFGFSGIIMLFIKNNERSIAVKIAVGASRFQIIFELFFEILFFCILGLVLGSLLGSFITYNLGITTNVIKYSYYIDAYTLAFLAVLATSITSIMPICFKIYKLSPYLILNDN
jgi:hypothetical protein